MRTWQLDLKQPFGFTEETGIADEARRLNL
jgi:hypothetical protein